MVKSYQKKRRKILRLVISGERKRVVVPNRRKSIWKRQEVEYGCIAGYMMQT